jgi:hypothetical protein
MIETLYKTHTPEKGRSECYVLVLTSRVSTGGKVFAFMEEHGQWNDDLQRFSYRVSSINTEEQLTYEHARGMYENSRRNLARKGFVHCFSVDGSRKEQIPDQLPEPELATA